MPEIYAPLHVSTGFPSALELTMARSRTHIHCEMSRGFGLAITYSVDHVRTSADLSIRVERTEAKEVPEGCGVFDKSICLYPARAEGLLVTYHGTGLKAKL